jgi:hypothetical protein
MDEEKKKKMSLRLTLMRLWIVWLEGFSIENH